MPQTQEKPAPAPLPTSDSAVGLPLDRVDGRAKVTGRATYAAEPHVDGVTHAVLVCSTIARGDITDLNARAAEAAPGVLTVLTPRNMPALRESKAGIKGETRMPLGDMEVRYAGQPVAVVVADTLARARHAAALVEITYAPRDPVVDLHDPRASISKPKQNFGENLQEKRGDVDQILNNPGNLTVVRQTYVTPAETHNPMEMSATVAIWDGPERLTVWDTTQHVVGRRDSLAEIFGLEKDHVRVLCPYVGGAFGCKGVSWPYGVLAVAAARQVGKPVKLMLTRAQMFSNTGHRPRTEQTLTLAAQADGRLQAVRHETVIDGSTVGEHVEPCGIGSSHLMYATPNLELSHAVHKVDVAPTTFMRAPGETPGVYALECAMDELAIALDMDPVQLRMVNDAKVHPGTQKPWSTRHLNEAFQLGMEKFGWSQRRAKPGSMRGPNGELLGWGMATATYPARKFPGTARIRVTRDGNTGIRATGAAATQDLGTGAYTVLTQITAAQVGLRAAPQVTFELGDTNLPPSAVSGGSATTASVGDALVQAGAALRAALLKIAQTQPDSPLAGLTADKVNLANGHLVAIGDAARTVRVADLISKSGRAYVEGSSVPPGSPEEKKLTEQAAAGGGPTKEPQFAFQSFGAHFLEVMIDQDMPAVRVTRVVSVMDIGRVINPKTARSQVIGGVIMGIGMALLEETIYDQRTGRPVNDNLADYAVCVNPDIHSLETHFLDFPDTNFSAMGCRGVGEIGITGVAAAVANAVYHATGKRIRTLPITLDKLL